MLQSFQARTEACTLSCCCHRHSHTDPGRLPTGVGTRQRVNMPFPSSKGFALSVLRLNGQAYPTVSHEGQIYVVMEPKDEFEVQVTRGSALDGCSSVVLVSRSARPLPQPLQGTQRPHKTIAAGQPGGGHQGARLSDAAETRHVCQVQRLAGGR